MIEYKIEDTLRIQKAGFPKTRASLLLALLMMANVVVWLVTLFAAHGHPSLLATGLLAYGFGLRHAVDADHISAIDNTTRKLMRDGGRPLGVGLFFSLGHSTIVILLCVCLALSTAYVQTHLPEWKTVGSLIGTIISSGFLYLIGVINLIVLWDLIKAYRSILIGNTLKGNTSQDHALEESLDQRGLLARLFRPLLRAIRSSGQMYIVGFLFGLGFDTASEVGILTLSARSGQAGTPIWMILLLPALFTVGMCLVDTLDGILMLGAYGWAYIKPVRKLHYNIAITAISVTVAFAVATSGLWQLWGNDLLLRGRIGAFLGDNLGYVIVGVFAMLWAVSALVYRLRGDKSSPVTTL